MWQDGYYKVWEWQVSPSICQWLTVVPFHCGPCCGDLSTTPVQHIIILIHILVLNEDCFDSNYTIFFFQFLLTPTPARSSDAFSFHSNSPGSGERMRSTKHESGVRQEGSGQGSTAGSRPGRGGKKHSGGTHLPLPLPQYQYFHWSTLIAWKSKE